jgi:hypothetical protein
MTICRSCGQVSERGNSDYCGCQYGGEYSLDDKISAIFAILENLGNKLEALEKETE